MLLDHQLKMSNILIYFTYTYEGTTSSSAPESDSAILLADIFSKPSLPAKQWDKIVLQTYATHESPSKNAQWAAMPKGQ